MSLIVKDSGGGDFKKMPQGTHLAICDMLVDLGFQRTEYMGVIKFKPKIYIRWNVPAERTKFKKDGVEKEGPMVIGAFYTANLSEKANLRHILESWRGKAFTEAELKGFDISNILGKPCQITVMHREANGKTYANVTAVTALPKGVPAPTSEIEPLKYSDEHPDAFDQLPEWLQEKVKEGRQDAPSDEKPPQSQGGSNDLDDDIPF